MKLVLPGINNVFDVEVDKINTIIIENQKLLMTILEDLYNQVNGHEGQSILSIDGKEVEISKNVELQLNYIPFEINQRKFLTKIIQIMEEASRRPENYIFTNAIITSVDEYIKSLAFSFPFELNYTKLSFDQILKSIGIEVNIDAGSLAEKVLSYMEIVREILGNRIYIFYDLRSFILDDEMKLLNETIIKHGYRVLFIESKECELLQYEKRYIVDNGLCEIL